MTDKEKLQKLFDAALKDPTLPSPQIPKRAFPVSPLEQSAQILQPQAFPSPFPVQVVAAVGAPVHAPAAPAITPMQVTPPVAQVFDAITVPADAAAAEAPAMPAALDDAASTELGALLDEQRLRLRRKRRMEALATAAVLMGSVCGGTIWFVQSPDRVAAFKEAMSDIRSLGDVKSLVAKYQDALDRIGARGKQIDQATAAMGVKKSAADDEDPFFEKEMEEMMGGPGNGKTVGQRNKLMKQNFSEMADKNGGALKSTIALTKEESFDWEK
jgi:hypothetical protein